MRNIPKALDQLTWLIASLSSLGVASGILSVAMLSMLIGLHVSSPLGAVSLAGASVIGVALALTKKYQKKLTKVSKLVDIVTSALAVYKMSLFKALNYSRVDEQEFNMLQVLHLEALNDLSTVDHKMEAETRAQLQKVYRKKSMT